MSISLASHENKRNKTKSLTATAHYLYIQTNLIPCHQLTGQWKSMQMSGGCEVEAITASVSLRGG